MLWAVARQAVETPCGYWKALYFGKYKLTCSIEFEFPPTRLLIASPVGNTSAICAVFPLLTYRKNKKRMQIELHKVASTLSRAGAVTLIIRYLRWEIKPLLLCQISRQTSDTSHSKSYLHTPFRFKNQTRFLLALLMQHLMGVTVFLLSAALL